MILSNYTPVAIKKRYVFASRLLTLLCVRPTFCKSTMVSIPISQLGLPTFFRWT